MPTRHRDLTATPAWMNGNNTRAMAICRVSSKRQKDGVSLPMQENHIKADGDVAPDADDHDEAPAEEEGSDAPNDLD